MLQVYGENEACQASSVMDGRWIYCRHRYAVAIEAIGL